jgi:hypothetical protein
MIWRPYNLGVIGTVMNKRISKRTLHFSTSNLLSLIGKERTKEIQAATLTLLRRTSLALLNFAAGSKNRLAPNTFMGGSQAFAPFFP